MGGQVGDSGKLTDDATGEAVDVYDTKRENGVAVHLVAKMPFNPEATFTAAINVERRQQIECNHTATHLLHYALRQVLGSHVEQKVRMSPPIRSVSTSRIFRRLRPKNCGMPNV